MDDLMARIKDRADWLVDAVATATQNRQFLRGEPECDEVACEAILLSGEKAMVSIAESLQARIAELEAALFATEAERDWWKERVEGLGAASRIEKLEAALRTCVGMLDELVAESGRGIEWDEEDSFRMGEWFEEEDLAKIEIARAELEEKKE